MLSESACYYVLYKLVYFQTILEIKLIMMSDTRWSLLYQDNKIYFSINIIQNDYNPPFCK